jgi:hypothetical protein
MDGTKRSDIRPGLYVICFNRIEERPADWETTKELSKSSLLKNLPLPLFSKEGYITSTT